MVRFCECGTLLQEEANEILTFTCQACKREYPARADDTLLYEDKKGIGITNYETLIKHARDDRLNPIRKAKCPTCVKEVWVNYIILGQDMTIVYTCLDCGKQWIP